MVPKLVYLLYELFIKKIKLVYELWIILTPLKKYTYISYHLKFVKIYLMGMYQLEHNSTI